MAGTSIIKHGKGKSAVPIFEVSSYPTVGGDSCYQISHIPTCLLIADALYFLSLARSIANNLLLDDPSVWKISAESDIRASIKPVMQHYLAHYRYNTIKQALTVEEYTNGIDYERILTSEYNRAVSSKQEASYLRELFEGDTTIAWVPHERGDVSATDLGDVIEGRPTSVHRVYSIPRPARTVWSDEGGLLDGDQGSMADLSGDADTEG